MDDTTLKAAQDLIANPDASSSEDLLRSQEALDLPGAKAAIEVLEGRRDFMLLKAGNDREIEAIDGEIRRAMRSLDRRRAADAALNSLIGSARDREAKAEIEALGVAARAARVRAIEAYIELDRHAIRVVELIGTVHAAEAVITDANIRFPEAGRGDLRVAPPMNELAQLAGCDGQFLPWLSRWLLHGYMPGPDARLGRNEDQLVAPERRFGRMAELLPAAAAPRKAA